MDYEQGLNRLRHLLRGTRLEYDFYTLEARLLENLDDQHLGGRAPQNQADRARIVRELNLLAGQVGANFTDLCRNYPGQRRRFTEKQWLIAGVSFFMALMLIVGAIFSHLPAKILILLHPTPAAVLAPTPVPTPAPLQLPRGLGVNKASNGEYIGVNDGRYQPFDMGPQRADSNLKQQATQALLAGNAQGATILWNQCLEVDPSDAETKIYQQNQNALRFTHVTLLVGLDFPTPSQLSADREAIMATRSALQGAYIAQEDFNNQHKNIKMRLLLVNTGNNEDYIPLVAQQIENIVKQDPTVVGILGWQISAITMNMTSDLFSDGVNIPIVSQSATYDNLNQASPHLYLIAPLNQEQADVALTLTKMLGKTQAIVFMDHHHDLASQNLGSDFEKGFTKAFNSTPIDEDFTVDNTKASQFYRELKDALKHIQHPDQLVVFFACTTNYDTGQFQEALGKLGNYSFPVIAGDAGYEANPPSYNHWYVLAYAFHDEYRTLMGNDPPFAHEYSSAFNADGQHNGWYGYDIAAAPAIMTYDAASILAHSINQAYSSSNNQITLQEIEYQLGQTIWSGVSGQINLTPGANLNDRALVVLKVVQQVDNSGKEQAGFHMYCLHGIFASNANNSLPAC
jgi:hypothetical protein